MPSPPFKHSEALGQESCVFYCLEVPWNLRKDGEVKIVTSPTTPSGEYRLKVEAKTKETTDTKEAKFKIR